MIGRKRLSNGMFYEKKSWKLNFWFPAFIREDQTWVPPLTRYTRYLVWSSELGRYRTTWTRKGWIWGSK